jgi:hypothetical protein
VGRLGGRPTTNPLGHPRQRNRRPSSTCPATRLDRVHPLHGRLCPQRGMLPLSQTPQRASSTTGHPMPACEVSTPRGMSMGRIVVAEQFVVGRRRRGCLRVEWLYCNQGQTSRTAAYGGLFSRPFPSARSTSLRTSFDGRERENQSSQDLDQFEGVLARMERRMVASTPAPAASSAPHHAPFSQGKFHSFSFSF